MLAIVTGIPGTGKSTVANMTLQELKEEGEEYMFINYGDIMFEIAKNLKIVEDRDDMRKLSPELQKRIQKNAAEKIAEISKKEKVLLDTHCTINTPKGFLPGLPEWILKRLNPSIIILIESEAGEIIKRRNYDKTRKRDMEEEEKINLQQEANRSIAMGYSILTGCTVKMIKNPQGSIEEAVKEMKKV